MDVHPPHEPIHTKRDFFLHLFTITIGLLIALSLEGLVEYMHHRHIVTEARENIRQEIENNHEAAQQDLVHIQKALDATDADLKTIRMIRDQPKSIKKIGLDYTLNFNQPDDAAWKTARETGALGYMPYKEVQDYSSLYTVQNIVNDAAVAALHREEIDMSPIISADGLNKMSPKDIDELIHNTADTYVELRSLKQIIQELDAAYISKLHK
jgi:hypothetical protein